MSTGELTPQQKDEQAALKKKEELEQARLKGEQAYGPDAKLGAIPEAGEVATDTVDAIPEIGNKSGEELLGAMIAWIIAMLLSLFAEGANKARREVAIAEFKNMAPQLKAMANLVDDKKKLDDKIVNFEKKNPKPLTESQDAQLSQMKEQSQAMQYGLDAYQRHLQNVANTKFARNDKKEHKALESIAKAEVIQGQAMKAKAAAGTDQKMANEADKIIQQQQAIIDAAKKKLEQVKESKVKLEGQTAQIDGKAEGISLGEHKKEVEAIGKATQKSSTAKESQDPVDAVLSAKSPHMVGIQFEGSRRKEPSKLTEPPPPKESSTKKLR